MARPQKTVQERSPRSRRTVPPVAGIFGLGYVGLAMAACLARRRIRVEGYEKCAAKRALLRAGICPVKERGLGYALVEGLATKCLRLADFDHARTQWPGILFICVGTPGEADGSINLHDVHSLFTRLARFARCHADFDAEIILRSTVPPGTLARLRTLHPALFRQVPVLFYPEFLREGTAMQDFQRPAQSVIGILPSTPLPRRLIRLIAKLQLPPAILVDAVTAESLKLASNAYHAVKICFANEVARLVDACGGNAVQVMDLFCLDSKLNVSRKYLQPGNPYGGSCLTKDINLARHLATKLGLKLDLLNQVAVSNHSHYEYIVDKVMVNVPQVVAILGLSFKKSTDDLRDSPSLELARRLSARGIRQMQLHDFLAPTESPAKLRQRVAGGLITGTTVIRHRSLKCALAGVDLILIMHADRRYLAAVAGSLVPVINVASWQRGTNSVESNCT